MISTWFGMVEFKLYSVVPRPGPAKKARPVKEGSHNFTMTQLIIYNNREVNSI